MADPLRLGVIGLGRAFTVMLPTFLRDPRVRLVAATDPGRAACERFAADFGGRVHPDATSLCADDTVEIVYVASPHEFHAEHVIAAARHRKHAMVEKPMALTLEECHRMVDAASGGGVHLLVGHSHSYDAPVLEALRLVQSGQWGVVRMIQAFNYTDYLYRARRPEELDTAQGGGVVHGQGAHQVDIVRLLGGGMVDTVYARLGRWDAARPTEGAYSAILSFRTGAYATLTYGGYGHFDSDEWHGGIGEMGLEKAGREKAAAGYGAARRRLDEIASPEEEARLKMARNYGGRAYQPPGERELQPPHYQHFGHVLVCCDHADLRITPDGVRVYADDRIEERRLPVPLWPRKEVIDELWSVVREGQSPSHSGAWGLATTEVTLAILASGRSQAVERTRHQVPTPRG
jgi:phthalate 4,5-cis-dihydrodiol dehydrogenase